MSGESDFKCSKCEYEWVTEDYDGCPKCGSMVHHVDPVKFAAARLITHAQDTGDIPSNWEPTWYIEVIQQAVNEATKAKDKEIALLKEQIRVADAAFNFHFAMKQERDASAVKLVEEYRNQPKLGFIARDQLEDFAAFIMDRMSADLYDSIKAYDELVGLLKKRFPQREDGTLPDFAIEDVLEENERLRAEIHEIQGVFQWGTDDEHWKPGQTLSQAVKALKKKCSGN